MLTDFRFKPSQKIDSVEPTRDKTLWPNAGVWLLPAAILVGDGGVQPAAGGGRGVFAERPERRGIRIARLG